MIIIYLFSYIKTKYKCLELKKGIAFFAVEGRCVLRAALVSLEKPPTSSFQRFHRQDDSRHARVFGCIKRKLQYMGARPCVLSAGTGRFSIAQSTSIRHPKTRIRGSGRAISASWRARSQPTDEPGRQGRPMEGERPIYGSLHARTAHASIWEKREVPNIIGGCAVLVTDGDVPA